MAVRRRGGLAPAPGLQTSLRKKPLRCSRYMAAVTWQPHTSLTWPPRPEPRFAAVQALAKRQALANI